MCLSLQGNLYIFIVGHSEGTVLRLLSEGIQETRNRPLSPFQGGIVGAKKIIRL